MELQSTHLISNEKHNVEIDHKHSRKVLILSSQFKESVIIDYILKVHKNAIQPIPELHHVVKYGYPIGHAKESIQVGEWVHTQNVQTNLEGTLQYTYQPSLESIEEVSSNLTFNGYVRENGDVGIRNEIWIINTVGCINKTCEIIAKLANEQFKDEN